MFNTWHDFYVCPTDAESIYTLEARLNGGENSSGMPNVLLVPLTDIIRGDDSFEVMEITDYGSVTIWTKKNVWCIRNEYGREKLIYLPRNPPPEKF